jgi:hypothetical protein
MFDVEALSPAGGGLRGWTDVWLKEFNVQSRSRMVQEWFKNSKMVGEVKKFISHGFHWFHTDNTKCVYFCTRTTGSEPAQGLFDSHINNITNTL